MREARCSAPPQSDHWLTRKTKIAIENLFVSAAPPVAVSLNRRIQINTSPKFSAMAAAQCHSGIPFRRSVIGALKFNSARQSPFFIQNVQTVMRHCPPASVRRDSVPQFQLSGIRNSVETLFLRSVLIIPTYLLVPITRRRTLDTRQWICISIK
jgi:hypothetical protein